MMAEMSMRGMPQSEQGEDMPRRTRKFIGAVVMVGFVLVYALIAMALAQARPIQNASALVQGIFYAALGIAWILPLMPLIKWMEKPDP
jgi:hypothetical protein